MALIAQVYLYQFSIANSKALSIYISISYSWTSSDTIYSFESYGVSVGFDFDNSKAFDDGGFKAFSNVIFNFDSYGVSIGFSDDNSKIFDDGGFNSFEDGVAEL